MGGGGSGGGDKKQLGRILLQQRLVTQEQLDSLLQQQRAAPGTRLASAAARSGGIAEVELLKALSEQHGVPGIDLSQVVIPLDTLKLIPADIARQHLILPILVKDERLFLAMADPADRRVIDEIEFVTGRRVFPYVALHEPLLRLIDEAYRLAEVGEPYYIGPNVPSDYLESIGLARGSAAGTGTPSPESVSPPSASSALDPRPGQHDAVVSAPLTTDNLDEVSVELVMGADGTPTLDPAFDSRAGTLPREPQNARARSGEKRTVLIVDDEEDIRRLLRRVLSDKGYEVVEAGKGLEALAAVREHVPSVIILDAMLPEVHGFDICRRIKGSQRYGHIPIIMVSAIYRGWRFAEDLRESYGVDAFLEKPFKIGDVLAAVERAVGGAPEPSEDPDTLSAEARTALASGIASYQGGDLDGAIEELKRGIGIDPLAFRLHYHLGLLYGRREKIYEAIQALETAVDLQPRHFAALKNLAVLYQKAGFKYKAIEMWERALGSAPDDETRRGIKDHLVNLL